MAALLQVTCVVSLMTVMAQAQNEPNFFVALPSVVQAGVEQKACVSVFNVEVPIPVHLQVFNLAGNSIFDVQQSVSAGQPSCLSFKVPLDQLPGLDYKGNRHLFIRAVSTHPKLEFDRRVKVALGEKIHSVFVQTDKPIYIRDDTVHMRFAVVRYDLLPLDTPTTVIVDIKNPQDIIVDRFNLTASSSNNPVIKKNEFTLGPSPMVGIWTIIVKHGLAFQSKSEFPFEVKNYVLPRFEVTIIPPKYVPLSENHITFNVGAKYTYGKPVIGRLTVRVGVWNETSQKAELFKTIISYMDKTDKGVKQMTIPNKNWLQPFPGKRRLFLFAEMKEAVSGVNQSSSDISAFFTDTPINLDCELTPPFYKANLQLRLKVRAKYSDGSSAARQVIEVTSHINEKLEKNTENDGVATFSVNTGKAAGTITILVKVRDQTVATPCYFKEFPVLPCGGSIVVHTKHQGALNTGTTADFQIDKGGNGGNSEVLEVTALLVSCGVIRQIKSFSSQKDSPTTFQMDISDDFCSKISVLVYYINSCDYVVADLVTVDVEKRCPNDVSLDIKVRETGVKPGEEINIEIKAAANSDVALLAVDSGLYILNNKNKLTKEQLFGDLLQYDKSCGYTGHDAKGIFDAAGLTSISGTTIGVTERENDQCSNRKKRATPVQESSCMCKFGRSIQSKAQTVKQILDFCADERRKIVEGQSTSKCEVTEESLREFRHCCNSEEYIALMKARGRSNGEENLGFAVFDEKYVVKRSFFPHVWLWNETINTGEKGEIRKTVTVPSSITEWVIHGLAFSTKKGFCATTPVKLRVFKPIFVECHFPYSFRREEQVSLSCSAFNYGNNVARVGMRIVKPSDGLCTSAGAGDRSPLIRFSIPSNGAMNQLFPIVPLTVGRHNISVQLLTQVGGDEIKKELRVVPEGIFEEYDNSAELDPQGSNVEGGPKCQAAAPIESLHGQCFKSVSKALMSQSPKCKDPLPGNYTKTECCGDQLPNYSVAWSAGQQCELCPSRHEKYDCNVANVPGGKQQINTFYTRLPGHFIVGSVTAWLSITGKYFEGEITVIDGIESVLRYPGGCGEQNMIAFGPNVALAEFFNATGQFFGTRKDQVLDRIKKGYQHQQRYRCTSGGFSVFVYEEPATWLSSFVLQMTCQAKNYVFVDAKVLSDLHNFLASRQNPNGQFYENGTIIHKEMLGGVQGGDASLTAFAMISILQCCSPPGEDSIPQVARDAVCKGVDYISSQLEANQILRPYTRAIVYLALLRACQNCQLCRCDADLVARARKLLDEKAVVDDDGSKHWPVGNQGGNAYWYTYRPQAISVETTAYALCGYVAAGDATKAGPIAKWLNSKRNSAGAFVSTQDTVVALKCLSKYSVYIKQDRSLRITLRAKHNKTFNEKVHINNRNSYLNQKFEIPVNDAIKVETSGTGLGLVQAHVEYNVPTTAAEQCRFDFKIESQMENANVNGVEGKVVLLNVCARYLGNSNTSMAMVEVDLPSGYVVCESGSQHCLKELNETKWKKIHLSSYEVRGRGPAFYFDTISHKKKMCFKFQANRQYEVENLVPASAKVYDYYEPDEKCDIFYSLNGDSEVLPVDCSTPIGKKDPLCICGAGHCPKIETIKNRLCQACLHHHYVYIVKILQMSTENGWQKIECKVLNVLKPGGRHDVVNGSTIYFWVASTCIKRLPLEEKGKYHVMGKDGPKFVLDHNALIEEYRETKDSECQERKCAIHLKRFNKKCKSYTPRKMDACKKSKKKCSNQKEKPCGKNADQGFLTYLKNIGERGACDKRSLCN